MMVNMKQASCLFLSLSVLLGLVVAPRLPLQPAMAEKGANPSVFVEPGRGSAPVVSLINSARRSLKLEVYILTDGAIFQALRNAVNRHVSVHVLLEQHPEGGDQYAQRAYSELRSDGISVKWANERAFTFTHEKAMEVDNHTAGIFTLNLSYSGLESNREFGVIDSSSKDAKAIGSIFNADWNRKPAHLSDRRLVVSPINARSSLTHLVDSAKHTLDLYEEEMEDSSFESHLISAEKRKVRVRLITSNKGSGVSRLVSHHVQVEILNEPYIHAKAIVADGTRLFLGSENISSTSLDHNRELGIMLGGGQAKTVEKTFQSDWRKAKHFIAGHSLEDGARHFGHPVSSFREAPTKGLP